MRRLVGPVPVLVLVLVAVVMIVASGQRAWVTGRTRDAVLGVGQVSATGADSVAGLVGLALVALAAAVAAATAGRVGRIVGLVAMALSTALLAVVVFRVILDPDAVLGRAVAQQLGRTGTVASSGSPTGWASAAACAVVLLAVACVLAAVGRRGWHGLSSRYEKSPVAGGAGTAESDVAGARGQRARSTWEQLSQGHDPTDDDGPAPT